MNKFYTTAGDQGVTGLLGKERVPKSDLRIETLGTIDELNSCLGLARSVCSSPGTPELLLRIQRNLYLLLKEIAASPENADRFIEIKPEMVSWLGEQTDYLGEKVTLPGEFIVPGDTPGGAALDMARTVTRRAERRAVALYQLEGFKNEEVLRFLNRLSSLLFVLELYEIQMWTKEGPTLMRGGGL